MKMLCFVDECGVSSIAGPVVVCAVAIEEGTKKIHKDIKDSKKISKKQRENLAPILKEKFNYSIKQSSVKRIEEINIHWAKYEAMKNAVLELNEKFNISKVIVDGGFKIPNLDIEQEELVKADEKLWEVGAASIIGKVYRDNLMAEFAKEEKYSYYDFQNNAGYYTKNHLIGIVLHGECDLHRKNFQYFKYCLDRHKQFLKTENQDVNEFLKDRIINGKKKSDYIIWKEAKKDFWKPILQEERWKL